MHALRSFSPAAAMYALLCTLYLPLWGGAAWRAGQRGPAGLDLDRRAPQVLTAVSLVDTAAALVVIPLLVIARVPRHAWIAAAGVFTLTTLAALAVDAQSTRIDLATVMSTRLLLLTITALAAAAARLAAAVCRDEHDAAGSVLLAALVSVGAAVFTAPLLVRLASADDLISGLLLANPLVTVAGATNFDVLRTEVVYRITPIGQRLFDYPSWQTAAATYAAGAVLCVLATMLIRLREA